ncbi:MAG: hypothetical protein OM95_01890 [Bdellovibrio sp. ArHS]|uniref:hypothetical protein n=1 Tax=Bdellovibrio sp. ArHS TaxID=1569284 RepID=UPI0005827DF3|nr:hypothetical protein [Bdellovibrio sp. ArHS]KHD89837.1 MAG: hypothetical protein OM95_01890 [Bdellovibrio sp. ArHS]
MLIKSTALRFLSLMMFTSLTVAPLLASARGIGSSGGGTFCIKPELNGGQPVLLDLALAKPNFQDRRGEQVHVTSVANLIGFDSFKHTETQAYQFAVSRVKAWTQVMPELATLEATLQSLQMVVTPFSLTQVNRAVVDGQSACQAKDLAPVIFYVDGRAHVSIPSWNKLGFYSQAAAFVHESLRQRQILHKQPVDDATLQNLTGRIMLDTPVRDEAITHSGLFVGNAKAEARVLTAAKKACATLYKAANKDLPGLKQALAPVHQKMDAFCEAPQADQVVIRDLMDVTSETLASSKEGVVVRQAILQIYNDLNHTLQLTVAGGIEALNPVAADSINALALGTDDMAAVQIAQAYLDNGIKPEKMAEAESYIRSTRAQYKTLLEQNELK